MMIILIKSFINSKLDLIQTVKFVKQLFRIQIQKGGKVLIWNQVKSRIEACYSKQTDLRKSRNKKYHLLLRPRDNFNSSGRNLAKPD